MAPKLSYVILCVADMDAAVRFYRDTLGFALNFQSPGWTEFNTGETRLALHSASAETPAGTIRLGIGVPDLHAFYKEQTAKGVKFTMPPTKQDFGGELAEFVDPAGVRVSVSGPYP